MRQKKAIKEVKDYFKLLPIGLILLIVPVIVYLKEVKLDSVVASYWKGSTKELDFFSYYKVAWFIALTCISVLFFFFYITTKKIKLTVPKMFLPLVCYLVFVFLSSSLSTFHTTAFFGFPDRYEGFFTILCYGLMCFLCSVLINSKFDIKYLMPFLAVSMLIVSIIGFTQFFGFDFLQTTFGKSLMLPKANQNLATELIFKFPEEYIYSTLYNPNYVGGFFAMILSICFVIFISSRNLFHKILSGVFCILSFINLLGSLSATGYISLAVASILIIIFLRKDLKRNCLPLIAILLCFCVITVVMNYTSGGVILGELGISKSITSNNIKKELPPLKNVSKNANPSNSIINENSTLQNISVASNKTNTAKFETLAFQRSSKATNTTSSTESETPAPLNLSNEIANTYWITDIKIDKNNVFLYVSETDALIVKYDSVSSQLLFTDNNNKAIEFVTDSVEDKLVLTFKDVRFQNLKLLVKNTLVSIEAPNTRFNLIITKDGFKFLTPSGQMKDLIKAESFGFEGKEKWGSYRGYIWSRSIPMIKDTILIGHGPDTYAMYFPQNDYMGKLKYMDNIYIHVDKPHNMYLQMAINTGLLSLIAFLIFVGWYCIASIKLYIKGLYNEYYTAGVACFVAVIAFLVSSLANDSTISVSPVFWILLGTGIACNRLYSKTALDVSVGKK